jgi:rhamnosyltransferase subunit B
MARILIATIGSLGDLHPFIAVALALKARGHAPVMAAPTDHVAKCRAAGLEAHAAFPDYASYAEEIGEAPDVIVRKVMASADYLVRTIILRGLDAATHALDQIAADADGIVCSMFALSAPIVAHKRGLALVPAMLQPLGLLSAVAPSLMPDAPVFARPSPGAIGQMWNRAIIRLLRAEMLRRYRGPIDAVRRAHGLGPCRTAPLFDVEGAPALRIALYDPAFAPLPPDAPAGTVATGFPVFDSQSGAPEPAPAALNAFLEKGPAPIVFTLGSFAVYAPGDFFAQSLAAARALGRRCVLLIGPDRRPPEGLGPDAIALPYAPHSALFPRAAAIVHHGGIGTTAQALRAGKPQLVVPFMADQPDNAERVARLGLGETLPARRYGAERARDALARRLADGSAAVRFAQSLIPDGAAQAAAAIEAALARPLS